MPNSHKRDSAQMKSVQIKQIQLITDVMDNERSSVCDNKMTKYNSTSSDSQIGIIAN